jgi:hypothetical protein
MNSETDKLLRKAISEKRLIRFVYASKPRIAEPHDYGVQKGQVRLLSFQVGGESNSGKLPAWRWLDVDKISDVVILEKQFRGGRPAPSGKHHAWDELFIRVA